VTRARDSQGRYDFEPACDCCGKPCGSTVDGYLTDDEVCGNTDGPGFFLCDRKRCAAKREGLTVEQRRELYTRQRAINEARKARTA